MKTLKLTLKKQWFDLMVSGVKKEEYRKPSKWIESRLVDKDGIRKKYDLIEFKNGYRKDSPSFLVEFKGFYRMGFNATTWIGGHTIDLEYGDYVIELGDIVKKENI